MANAWDAGAELESGNWQLSWFIELRYSELTSCCVEHRALVPLDACDGAFIYIGHTDHMLVVSSIVQISLTTAGFSAGGAVPSVAIASSGTDCREEVRAITTSTHLDIIEVPANDWGDGRARSAVW